MVLVNAALLLIFFTFFCSSILFSLFPAFFRKGWCDGGKDYLPVDGSGEELTTPGGTRVNKTKAFFLVRRARSLAWNLFSSVSYFWDRPAIN